MTTDLDRDIVTIKYNLLNLPDLIQFKNGNQIINSYATDGRKLGTEYFTLATPVIVPINSTREWTYELDVVGQTGIQILCQPTNPLRFLRIYKT